MDGGMTRDEFLYRQLKDGRSLYLGLTVVYGLAAAAAIVMAFFAYGKSGLTGAVILLAMGVGLGLSAHGSWSQHAGYASALDEVGADPAGIDTCRTYSASTALLIGMSRMPAKGFLQQWVSYGIIALMLLGFGIFLVVLCTQDIGDELMLLGLGALLLVGGALLLLLTVKAFHNWRAAKRLELLDQSGD